MDDGPWINRIRYVHAKWRSTTGRAEPSAPVTSCDAMSPTNVRVAAGERELVSAASRNPLLQLRKRHLRLLSKGDGKEIHAFL